MTKNNFIFSLSFRNAEEKTNQTMFPTPNYSRSIFSGFEQTEINFFNLGLEKTFPQQNTTSNNNPDLLQTGNKSTTAFAL
jgi:hypothetical protein